MTRMPVIVDPALKPMADKLDRLFGFVTGLEDHMFEVARHKAVAARESVTVILPGPLPCPGHGFPTSVTYVELVGPALNETGSVRDIARLALLSEAEVLLRTPPNTTADWLSQWRNRPPNALYSMSSAPDREPDDGALLHGLLSGKWGSDLGSPQEGFWAAWARSAEEGPSGLDAHLAHVLTHNCLWFEPYFGEPCAFGTMLETAHLIEDRWRQNDKPCHCFGAQYWNHPSIKATFSGAAGDVCFYESVEDTLQGAKQDGGRVLSWAGRTTPDFERACRDADAELLRIEDGFIRSVGLGAGLARGASLATDDLGIYYDPSRPSRLEFLLQEAEVLDHERERAERFIRQIVEARVSKYNYGRRQDFDFPKDREVVLVPGQVADDAAVRKSRSATIDCANGENVNLELLKVARQRDPEAFIVFKPHPDVETGLRRGRLEKAQTLEFADRIAGNADIADLLDVVDRVETFSSLSGFEALLRGKRVTVHGLPFYAGWGLCEELTECERRTRLRSLAEVVYLSFFAYCRTIDPVTLLPCTPEVLLRRLVSQRQSRWHRLRTTVIREISWLGRKLGI